MFVSAFPPLCCGLFQFVEKGGKKEKSWIVAWVQTVVCFGFSVVMLGFPSMKNCTPTPHTHKPLHFGVIPCSVGLEYIFTLNKTHCRLLGREAWLTFSGTYDQSSGKPLCCCGFVLTCPELKRQKVSKILRKNASSHQLLLQLTCSQIQGGHHHTPLCSFDASLDRRNHKKGLRM